MFIATLVAKDRLDAGEISAVVDRVGGTPGPIVDGVACDITVAAPVDPAHIIHDRIDIIVQPLATRDKALMIADMDSTMITVECIDELADYAGLKAEVASITDAAMRGDLDFEAALDARVALLAGMAETVIDECRASRVREMPGARALVRTLRATGARAVLVSGGFTHFADPVATAIGFDRAVANRLEIADGVLTGRVLRPIVDARAKSRVLAEERDALNLSRTQTLAVGDGANDLPMVISAGLGVAYHAKPALEAAAPAAVRHGDLSVILYALGFPKARWVVD